MTDNFNDSFVFWGKITDDEIRIMGYIVDDDDDVNQSVTLIEDNHVNESNNQTTKISNNQLDDVQSDPDSSPSSSSPPMEKIPSRLSIKSKKSIRKSRKTSNPIDDSNKENCLKQQQQQPEEQQQQPEKQQQQQKPLINIENEFNDEEEDFECFQINRRQPSSSSYRPSLYRRNSYTRKYCSINKRRNSINNNNNNNNNIVKQQQQQQQQQMDQQQTPKTKRKTKKFILFHHYGGGNGQRLQNRRRTIKTNLLTRLPPTPKWHIDNVICSTPIPDNHNH
uniref:Probable serine/threonine-protein kinase yakA n=1 Tax=Dermatophagoides pteronyssinus TaxID=6956 RepID=A0A6P6XL61_DERPT|nr:probable serine/threonine-protein kinase yakA [Dermatophagoides pteronyssinus]